MDTLALLEEPQTGSVSCTLDRKEISYCMQTPLLFKTSVKDNIAYGLKLRKIDDPKKVEAMARKLGIAHLLGKKATELSGGEAQKVALARTLILETPVVLLDEPTASLDVESIAMLELMLKELSNAGACIIMATHQQDKAFRLADEVVTIKEGQVYPNSHQNFYSGKVMDNMFIVGNFHNEGGVTSPRLHIAVVSDKKGPAKASIDPVEIILSKEKLQSSARNSIEGKIATINDEGKTVKLIINIGVPLVSQITHGSLRELGLHVGDTVYATFKASAVMVY
ncbi:MAG: ATP-binding cassette domain-containing protein [Candidatus Margulisiibacteriota bacterium]